MKKGFLVFVAGILAFVLAACNDKAEPTEDASKENESDMSAEEVYTKALEASEDMESAEVTMNMNQQMDPEGEEGSVETDSNFDMQMTMEPLAMYMDGTTTMKMDGADAEDMPDMDMDMEIYMVDDGMYMYSDQIGTWMKMDGASMDMVEEMAGQQPDPSEQLKMIKDYTDDLSFEQSDDEFILKLDADGEKFNDFFHDMIEENLSSDMLEQMGEDQQDIFDDMNINSMSLELGVDKETFDMNTYNVDMDMTMEVEGQTLNIAQTMESEYSNFNNVDPIEVPDDVKDEAIDQDEMMEQQGNMNPDGESDSDEDSEE